MNKYGVYLSILVEPETLKTILYGFSVLSGPTLAIGIASIWCLVPFHNVLKEPCYWYEFHVACLVTFIPFMIWTTHPMSTEYWANFSMKRGITSYVFLYFVTSGTFITAIAIYYHYWGNLAQPMPLNANITFSLAYAATITAVLAR